MYSKPGEKRNQLNDTLSKQPGKSQNVGPSLGQLDWFLQSVAGGKITALE